MNDNDAEVARPNLPCSKLPVARAVWKCRPDFKTAVASWIYSGGAHHTVYSYSVTTEQLRDFAEIAGVELVLIDAETRVEALEANLAKQRGLLPVRNRLEEPVRDPRRNQKCLFDQLKQEVYDATRSLGESVSSGRPDLGQRQWR